MRRTIICAAMAAGLLGRVAAAEEAGPVDFWAATEVIMGQIGPTTMQQLRQSPELMNQYTGVLVDQFIAQEAVTRGLTERLDVQRALHVARRNVLVRAMRDELVRQMPKPTEAEIKAVYQKQRDRWIVPIGYRLDVFSASASDAAALDAAKKLATGAPVADEDLNRLVNVQTQVLMRSGLWLTSNNMPAAIWREVAQMKEKELRLFPDGAQTLVIRRGPAREPKLLTLDEAAPFIRDNLMIERADQIWSNYLAEARARLK